MDVNEITFGVEIECLAPRGAFDIGGYHYGRQIDWAPEGWNAQHDSSIHSGSGSLEGVEIVSGILRGAEGVRQVKTVVARLHELGCRVNGSCGLHVHVGFPHDAQKVERLVTLVANFEVALYASTGTHARENGYYSSPVSRTYEHVDIRRSFRRLTGQDSQPRDDAVDAAGIRSFDRYRSVNVTNLVGGARPTVEFRAFAGTLNVQKIIGYIRLCVGLVERALTVARKTTWTARKPVASSPIARKGDGATCLTRLFYQLGWTKGRTAHVYGDLTAEGLPALATSKRTLMKLARKYDSQGSPSASLKRDDQ